MGSDFLARYARQKIYFSLFFLRSGKKDTFRLNAIVLIFPGRAGFCAIMKS